MNDAHLHLLVNHVPILGTLFALLLGAYGAVRQQPAVVRAAFLALIVSGIGGYVAQETGEGAEEIVEELGIDHRMIHEHEEAAEWATWAGLGLAAVALGVLMWRRREPEVGTIPTVGVLVFAAVVFAMMARVGNLGGEIRHTEVRDGATAAPTGGADTSGEEGDHDDDD